MNPSSSHQDLQKCKQVSLLASSKLSHKRSRLPQPGAFAALQSSTSRVESKSFTVIALPSRRKTDGHHCPDSIGRDPTALKSVLSVRLKNFWFIPCWTASTRNGSRNGIRRCSSNREWTSSTPVPLPTISSLSSEMPLKHQAVPLGMGTGSMTSRLEWEKNKMIDYLPRS